ncbi:MAG: sensor histidine kinase, partial [Bacillota bacterium]|nr:sensor histidine kinase [Bacillota bacterium]
LVSVTNVKILEAIIMESLTNAAKHSKAQGIHMKINIGKKHLRYYFKDDGIGCLHVSENLGISGMRDRIKNAGGTIAIDGSDGFLIVCHLPIINDEDYREEEDFANSYC